MMSNTKDNQAKKLNAVARRLPPPSSSTDRTARRPDPFAAWPCGMIHPIGAPGFEPGTSPTRTVRATRLRHAPRGGDYPRRARQPRPGSLDFGDRPLDLGQGRPVLQGLRPPRAVDDCRPPGAYPELCAELLVAFEPLRDRAVRALFAVEGLAPLGHLEIADRAGQGFHELVVDPQPLGLVLVAEEEVGVLPAVALLGGGLGTEEADLERVARNRVVAHQQLRVAGPGVVFDQTGDRTHEGGAAARALEVVEDLDRDRGIGGAEPVPFLRHTAEEALRVRDPGDADHLGFRLLGRDADRRVAQCAKGESEAQNDPDAPAGGRGFDG